MRCPPGHTKYHAMPARPYYTMRYPQGHTISSPPGNTIHHAMPARLFFYHIPCHASSGHTIYYAMPARPYLFPCHARQAIPYTMPCPYHIPCHAHQAILNTMLSPMPCLPSHNHILCDARQAIPNTMRCPPDHTIPCDNRKAIPYQARQAIPYTMPCPPGFFTIYHAMHHLAILYTMLCMPARPYHLPCHAHTTYHAMPTRPYHIPYHATQDIPFTMSCLAIP